MWPDLANFRQIVTHFKSLRQLLESLLNIWLNNFFGNFSILPIRHIFIVTNGQIWKINIAIWSHCWCRKLFFLSLAAASRAAASASLLLLPASGRLFITAKRRRVNVILEKFTTPVQITTATAGNNGILFWFVEIGSRPVHFINFCRKSSHLFKILRRRVWCFRLNCT